MRKIKTRNGNLIPIISHETNHHYSIMKQCKSSSFTRIAFKSLSAAALLAIGCPMAVYANSYPLASAQTSSVITGFVTDESGEPIIGASVRVKGGKDAVTTDIDGKFRINASAGQQLEFAYVGCKPVAAAASEGMVIKLSEDSQVLGEVVVLGYNTVKKSDLTGSVASMGNADLLRSGLTNAAGSMQGSIPGVTIQKANNKPGGDYNILIRGLNTISGST
ncbi:MAG: carboxypeptidase-like regulatory domain-containing protein, partial [Lachnospiraceae bacterium]|nr:carboxypeptidase-like regulatory domain-containing protein [Lachnospiraceae bacterium]